MIHLLGQKILGNLQQGRGPFSGKMVTMMRTVKAVMVVIKSYL